MKARRWAGLGTMLVVAATGMTSVDASGAQRSEEKQETGAHGQANVLGPCGGAAVPLTGTQNTGSYPPLDGQTRVSTIDLRGTSHNTSFRATGEVRTWATRNAWGTRRATLSATLRAATAPTAARTCGAALSTVASGGMHVTVPKRSWLVVRSTVSSALHGWVTAERAGATTPFLSVPLGKPVTRLVAAGGYFVGSTGAAQVQEDPADTGASESGSLSSSMALYPVGTRRSLTGNGTGYLTVGHRDCSLNRVRASFTAAGRSKVSKATFSVNGTRRLVLRGSQLPRSGVFLGSIARTSPGSIRADLVLRSGARRTTYATSWPCA